MIIVIGLTVGEKATLRPMIAHMLSHVFYALGSILLGIATLRAGIMPKAAAILMAIGPVWLSRCSGWANQSFLLCCRLLSQRRWLDVVGIRTISEKKREPLARPQSAVQ